VSPRFLTQVLYRFSTFEADPQAGELRKNGLRLRIQDQPFQILLRLLERPGQIVTREELKTTLWSVDTFVDFDNGLNMAVKRLREALGDDADHPRFIETLPRRGYRFIGQVDGRAPSASEKANDAPSLRSSLRTIGIWTVAVSFFALAVILVYRRTRSEPQRWRGPASVMTPDGIIRTPSTDVIYVLPVSAPLDVSAELTCDWRPGSRW